MSGRSATNTKLSNVECTDLITDSFAMQLGALISRHAVWLVNCFFSWQTWRSRFSAQLVGWIVPYG